MRQTGVSTTSAARLLRQANQRATPQRVADAALGSEVALERADWYELFRAAGYTVP